MSGESEKTARIRGAAGGNRVEGNAPDLGHTCCHGCDIGRLVALATSRDRSEKRTVGFNQETILRDLACTLVGGNSLGEGHCAAEADVKTKLQERMHLLRRPTPAMHHP